jgi:transcriptional regulator with XRE-family HTH domain
MKDEPCKPLKDFRAAADLNQTEMARLMDMGISAYQDIETGFSKFKGRHQMILERASEKLAVERKDGALALPAVRRDALDLAKLIRGEGA